MTSFSLVIISTAIFTSMVNGLVNVPNAYNTRKSRQMHPVTAQQLQTQIAHLQKMLKELRSLEYKELHQKPLTSSFYGKDLVHHAPSSKYVRSYAPITRPLNYHYRHQEIKRPDPYQSWYPVYSSYLRSPYHQRDSI